jgi:nucleoid DNA-binding protein
MTRKTEIEVEIESKEKAAFKLPKRLKRSWAR